MMRRLALLLVAGAFVASVPSDVLAHPLAPAVLSFMPAPEAGTTTMTWRAPAARPKGQSLQPAVPQGCEVLKPTNREFVESGTAVIDTTLLRCNPPGLVGKIIRVEGFDDSTVNVVVRVGRDDGSVQHAILGARTPTFTLAADDDQPGSFVGYLTLGIEHLLTGWDHLTFLLGLLILFGWHRRLIAAVTAFTLGHSLTLALSVFGIIDLPSAPVEALIAATIVVLALEIQSGRDGPVWKHPWALPAALGLLHGLGFASVLFDAGLPANEIPLALLGFNLGIEVGQLGVIACLGLVYRVVRGAIPNAIRQNRVLPAYVIGSLAAYWVIERTLAAFGIVA